MKILIIAKNEHTFIFDFIQKIYASGYYIIKLVHTPTDAVLSMRQLAPDIVILDMDFIFETADATMLEQIHSYNNIPVIYSVHSSVTEMLDNSMYSRPFGYISYDSTQEEISEVLEKAYDNINLVKKTTIQSNMMNVLMNNSSTGIIIMDQNGKILKHNKLFFDIFNTAPSLDSIEKISGGCINFDRIKTMLAGNKKDLITAAVRGSIKYLSISVETCEWYSDEIILMFVSDFTQVHKTKNSLAEAELRFSKIFNARVEPCVIVKCSGCEIFAANPAFAEIYKVKHEKCAGSSLVTYIGQEVSNLLKLRSFGKDNFTISRVLQQSFDGDNFIVNIIGKKILFENVEYFLLTLNDITEMVKAEEAKNLFQNQLMQANKLTALGTLVSCMAHEINNPNNFIMFNISLINEYMDIISGRKMQDEINTMSTDEIYTDVYELIEGISKGAERIKIIVEDLKGFSRTGQIGVFQKICVKDAIETSVRLLGPKIRKATRRFKMTFEDDKHYVYGNQQKLEQIFMNIIMNSVESIKKHDSLLEIKCFHDANYQIVEIIDEGMGIAEENLGRLLDPFFSTKTQTGGTGLGLYIANSIIKEHRGFLSIRSKVSVGTTVTIKFPKYSNV